MVEKRFNKKKIAISLNSKLIEKIDKIKAYPQWSDNRSYLIEEAVYKFINDGSLNECQCLFCKKKDNKIKTKTNYWMFLNRVHGVGICYKCVKKRLDNESRK